MRSRSGYQRLGAQEDNPYRLESEDERFRAVPQEVPWASIALAIFLMIFGVFSFVLAWLHLTQRLLGKEQAEIGFTILGAMTFVPGAYHTYIAYGAYRGWSGFSYDSIPQY